MPYFGKLDESNDTRKGILKIDQLTNNNNESMYFSLAF